jgi:hypothetical protein
MNYLMHRSWKEAREFFGVSEPERYATGEQSLDAQATVGTANLEQRAQALTEIVNLAYKDNVMSAEEHALLSDPANEDIYDAYPQLGIDVAALQGRTKVATTVHLEAPSDLPYPELNDDPAAQLVKDALAALDTVPPSGPFMDTAQHAELARAVFADPNGLFRAQEKMTSAMLSGNMMVYEGLKGFVTKLGATVASTELAKVALRGETNPQMVNLFKHPVLSTLVQLDPNLLSDAVQLPDIGPALQNIISSMSSPAADALVPGIQELQQMFTMMTQLAAGKK